MWLFFVLTLVLCCSRSAASARPANAASEGAEITGNVVRGGGVGDTGGGSPLHIVFQDVTMEIGTGSKGGGPIKVLDDVNGEALPGRMLALMGPSGSGKTSLLNVIANQVPYTNRMRATGTVTINGVDRFDAAGGQHAHSHRSDLENLGRGGKRFAYVRQKQAFYSFLTVRETLMIRAGLRLASTSREEQERMVQSLIDRLELTQAADTRVGGASSAGGISGGEARRLAVAMELIGLETPSLVLVDEPTSGLDSFQAQQMMQAMRVLCQEGHTVVVCLHQPRSSIFALFDDVMVLAGGQVMYLGAADQLEGHFASLGYPMPPSFNPADFVLDLVSLGFENGAEGHHSSEERIKHIALAAREAWKERRLRQEEVDEEMEQQQQQQQQQQGSRQGLPLQRLRSGGGGAEEEEGREGAVVVASGGGGGGGGERSIVVKRPGFLGQARLLLKRSWWQATRDKSVALSRALVGAGLGAIIGSVFFKLKCNEQAITDRAALMVNVVVNVAMVGCVRALQTFSTEKPVIAIERLDQGYHMASYWLSKVLAELPTELIFPAVFGPVVYSLSGLNRGKGKLRNFMGILLLECHASSALGLMIGCLAPSSETASVIGPAVNVVFLLLCGLNLNIPPAMKKLEALSTIKWATTALMRNEFKGLTLDSAPGKVPNVPVVGRFLQDKGGHPIPGEDVLVELSYAGYEGKPGRGVPAGGRLSGPFARLGVLTMAFHLVTLGSLCLTKPRFQSLEEPPEDK